MIKKLLLSSLLVGVSTAMQPILTLSTALRLILLLILTLRSAHTQRQQWMA